LTLEDAVAEGDGSEPASDGPATDEPRPLPFPPVGDDPGVRGRSGVCGFCVAKHLTRSRVECNSDGNGCDEEEGDKVALVLIRDTSTDPRTLTPALIVFR